MTKAPPGWGLVMYAGERWRMRPPRGMYAWIEQGPISDPIGKWVHIRTLKPAS